MKHPDYPGASSFVVKNNTYWRFRKTGLKPMVLPGEPHTAEFDAAYQAAITGKPYARILDRPKAEVVPLHEGEQPKSFKAAWRLVKNTSAWRELGDESSYNYILETEAFLLARVADGVTALWGNQPMADLRRRHIRLILDRHAGQPFKQRKLLTMLKKLVTVALDEEWMEIDPTYGIRIAAATAGHRAWPIEIRDRFEAYWPIGSTARTAYALAIWLGNRRSDVATLRWDQMVTRKVHIDGFDRIVQGFEFTQHKGRKRKAGKTLFLPLTPMLAEALAPLPRTTQTILTTLAGQPYRIRSLSEMMKRWAMEAGIERGFVLHGLRKSLGKMLAEEGATTREGMDVLGHSNIAHFQLYSAEAEQRRLSVQGMDKITRSFGKPAEQSGT